MSGKGTGRGLVAGMTARRPTAGTDPSPRRLSAFPANLAEQGYMMPVREYAALS